jgi:hypothetical protein
MQPKGVIDMERHAAIDLAEFRWYAISIENAAIQVFAVGDHDRMEKARRLFSATLREMLDIGTYTPGKSPGGGSCPWIWCPDGRCSPDCLGTGPNHPSVAIDPAIDPGHA